MDAATSNPLFQAVDKMLSRASLPDVKAPVDLLALIQEYGDAKFKYGAQSVSDRWHQEYADAPNLGPITEEVERLQGAEFVLLEVVNELLAKCEVSDDACYGTLSTSFVRDMLTKALAEVEA